MQNKNFLTKSRWLVTIILLTALGSGNVWGTDVSFTIPKISSYTSYTINGVSWTVAGTGGALGQNVDGTKGAQIGTAKNPATALSFSTSGISGTITSITVNTSGASSVSATVAVSVGSTSFNSNGNTTRSISATATNYTFTGSASGTITISWSQSSSKALYVKTISVTYSSGTSVSLSKAGETNGSFTLSPTGPLTTTSTTASTTVTASPNAGYYLSNLTASNPSTGTATVTGSGNTRTVTYSSGANGSSTITATFSCLTPTITTQPSNGTCERGVTPTPLTVVASQATGSMIYQWKECSTSGGTYVNVTGGSGGTTASYTPPTSSVGTMYYRCVVTNASSGCSTFVTSNYASFEVTAPANFTNGETVFIQAGKNGSAWDASACVKAWFNASGAGGAAQTTYWLFDVTAEGDDKGKKLFAAVVPSTGDLNQVTLQRFASNCSDFYNNNGTLTKASSGGSNTFRSENSGNSGIAWNLSGVTLSLKGSPNSWGSSLGTFSDQGNGVWTANYNNYEPSTTSANFKIETNYNGWIGNTGSNSDATLSDMIVGSTYNVTATLDVKDHSLVMSKTFVKGEVSFDLQGHGSAISKLTNVTAGSKISAPSEPSVEGWTFGGWYKEPSCTNAWNFASDVVNETMTLYAKWTVKTYTIDATLNNTSVNTAFPTSFTYTGSTTTDLNRTFSVNTTNFFLPSSITVTMGGSTLTQGTHYTYNNTTGAFTFSAVITGNIVITATATAKLKSIAITTQPTTRAYLVGETFSSAGAAVTATMGDGSTKAVSATWTPTGALSAGTGQTVTATYTEAGIEKTATTTINVYNVTVQKYDETPAEITNAGVTVGANGRTLSQSVGSTKYVFNNWTLITASGMSISTNSLTGTPTGDVVVRGNFYKPVVITWLKGGLPYETGSPTTTIARGSQWKDLTLPDAPGDASLGACATKFMGWSNTMLTDWVKEDHHTEPATLFTSVSGNTTVINDPITFRAVFATAGGGSVEWVLTDIADLTGSDIFVLAESASAYAMTNDNGTTSAPAGAAITVVSNKITSEVAANMQWNISGNGSDGYVFYPNGSTTTWLYCNTTNATGSNNNMRVGDGARKLFVLDDSGELVTNDNYVDRYLRYYGGTEFRGYISKDYGSAVAPKCYKKTGGTTYSDYVTVCCTQYDITLTGGGTVTGGTISTGGTASACEGAEVTLSATPADGYSFAGWTVTKTASPYTDITSTNVDGNTLTMPGYGVTVNATFATLTGITVKTAPTKTTYCQGEYFDPTDLVITATFSNSTSLDIPYAGNEAKFTFSPTTSTALTTGNTPVSITYGGKSTNQSITVNALRTITLTGSGSVTGGTFTADNATACVGATITINAVAGEHYTFSTWTIEKARGGTVTPLSATSASTTFTMPDDNVTITAAFNESAYKTVVFNNDGSALYSGEGYDNTNHWKQKVYVGETPVAPTTLRDGYGPSGDACNDESTSFYGWTKNTWNDVIETEAAVKERTAGNTVYKTGVTLATVTAGDPETIYYNAVWAKGDVVPTISNPLLVKWAQQSLSSTPVAGVKADGTASTATLASSKSLTTANGTYAYGESGMGSSDITITISGLDFSGYNSGAVSFYVRASQGRTLTIKESSGGDYSTVTTSSTSVDKFHVIRGISNTTTSIQIIYPTAATAGSFYIGTFCVFGINTSTSYTFTKLTSSNTSGWTTDDWDGYYIIADGTAASSLALDGGGIYGDGPTTVTVTDGTTITTSDPTKAFEIKYDDTEGKYTIQGIGCRDYVCNSGKPVPAVFSASYYNSIAYNELTASSGNYLRKHSSNARFGVYTGENQPTLYKTLSVLTKFRTTCCEKLAVTKTGSGTVTGGTFTVDKDNACEDEEVTLSVTSTSSGYNFDHWAVAGTAVPHTDYSSNVSEGGILTMPSEAVTVTAVFAVAHTTTVTLDNQEATSAGTTSVTATVNLPMPEATMPTKSGYTFGGYYSAPNGSGTQYYAADGSSAHIWDDGESATATLYAKWTASGYTVTLNKEGATTQGTASVSVTFGANTNLTTPITCPTYTGKVFGGYWTTASGEGTQLIDVDGNWMPSVTGYIDVNRNWLYANNLELHARWSNVSYTNYRTTCGPEITVTGGPVYLTSYAGCEVLTTGNITVSSENWQSTVGAPKYLRFKLKDIVSGTTYAFTGGTSIASSEFRIYNSSGNGGSYADQGYIAIPTGTTSASYDFRIAYTPAAGVYNTLDHYVLEVEVMDNSATKKTLTMETEDLYGRTLPEQFVIAAKKGGVWYALPNDLAGTEAATKAAKAVEIIVDNTTTPTTAIYAPENTLYKATGYYTGPNVSDRNRSGVRFTRNGSQYLQVSTVEGTNLMWLSATGGTDVQDWYLNSSNFSVYSLKIDPRGGTSGYRNKVIGIFGSHFGFYNSAILTSGASDIYLLPVETVLAEATVVEWGAHKAIVEADAGSTGFNASTIIARIDDEATTPMTITQTLSGKGAATKYNWTINVGNTFDFTDADNRDKKLFIDWLNSSGSIVRTSMIPIPWIIAGTKTMSTNIDAVKTHWSNAEVHVLPGAVLTADAGSFESSAVTIGTLEIYPGATVKVTTGTLDVSDLVLRYGWTRVGEKEYNTAQLQIKRGVSGANLTTTRAYADWYIDYDQFYSMSVPWNVTVSKITYKNSNSAASAGMRLRYYDGENRASTGQSQIGQNWKDYGADGNTAMPETLLPSMGYAITAKRPTGKAFSILRMPLTIPNNSWTALGEQGEVSSAHKNQVTVTGWGYGMEAWYAMGWNFIGNPYMSTFNGDDSGISGKLEIQNGGEIRYATIPDLGFKGYDQVPIAEANISPASGFFIQANNPDPQIVTFSANNIVNPSAPARFVKAEEKVPDQEVYIRLSHEGGKDQMGLIIGEDYTEAYEPNADLAKVLGEANTVKTYMNYGGMDMAYVAINSTLAKEWIPVTVKIPADGEYTFSLMNSSTVEALDGVFLIDYAKENTITNLIENDYVFTAEEGMITDRFAINAIFGEREVPTVIDAVETSAIGSDKPIKFLFHEKVFILYRGVIYDAVGKKVREINK